jgi:hypothetical protein
MSVLPAGAGAVDPEAQYFQAVEEYFVGLRGDPLMLSNADWLLIRRWRRAGIPLRIVLRGIRDALDAHAHSWGRDHKVGSLRYCEREVGAARERWHRALRLGQDGELSHVAQLQNLARGLRGASDLPARVTEVCVQVAEEIEAEIGRARAPGTVEKWLHERELLLLRAIRRALDEEALADLETAIERDLAPYRERMPASVVEQVRKEAVARGLFARFGLPRLSLFHTG